MDLCSIIFIRIFKLLQRMLLKNSVKSIIKNYNSNAGFIIEVMYRMYSDVTISADYFSGWNK